MIISCKCGKVIVDAELKSINEPEVLEEFHDDDGELLYANYHIPENAIMKDRMEQDDGKKVDILTVHDTTLASGLIPDFDHDGGHTGCCNHDHWDVRCECGSFIGYAHLDCWQTRGVRLLASAVTAS